MATRGCHGFEKIRVLFYRIPTYYLPITSSDARCTTHWWLGVSRKQIQVLLDRIPTYDLPNTSSDARCTHWSLGDTRKQIRMLFCRIPTYDLPITSSDARCTTHWWLGDSRKQIRVLLDRSWTFDLRITSSDFLPLSYRRLVGTAPLNQAQRPVSRKSRKVSGFFRVSQSPSISKERRIETNFTIILIFVNLKTCLKTSLWKQAEGSFVNGFSGPKTLSGLSRSGPQVTIASLLLGLKLAE